MISATLVGLRRAGGHPLAREVYFHIVSLGLRFLRHATAQSSVSKWKLKDLVLSAALNWFSHPPR